MSQPISGPASLRIHPAHGRPKPWACRRAAGARGCRNGVRTCGRFIREDYQKPKADFARRGIKPISANCVRNRCDFQNTTRHQKTKKNRHRLRFPVAWGNNSAQSMTFEFVPHLFPRFAALALPARPCTAMENRSLIFHRKRAFTGCW